MANDLNAAVEQVNATVAKCLAEVQQTRAKIDAGEVRAGDLDTKINKMDEAIKGLDAGLAAARAQAAAQPVVNAGDVSKRFAEKGGGVRLFDGIVERRLEGSPEPIRRTAEGYLSSAETLSQAQLEAKACWELGVIRAIRAGALRMDGEGRVSRSAAVNAVATHAPGMLDRIAVLAEADGLGDASAIRNRVFGVAAGSGSDMIPAEVLLPEVARVAGANQRGGLASLFGQRSLTAKNTYINTRTSLPRVFNKGLASSAAAAEIIRSSSGTGKVAMDPKPFACGVDVDRDADDDAVVSMMLEVRADIAAAMALAVDDAIINGDTTASHGDDGSGALASWNPEGVFNLTGAGGALDHRRMFLGLRHRALDMSTSACLDLSGTITFAKLNELRGKMTGGRGMNAARTAIITDFMTIVKHLHSLAEVVTLEKFGPNATILSGQVIALGGCPVIRTPFMGRSGANTGSFNASGVFATSSVTKAAILLADLEAYILGTRKGVTLESDTSILTDTVSMVATGRYAWMSPDHPGALSTSSVVNVAYGYNL